MQAAVRRPVLEQVLLLGGILLTATLWAWTIGPARMDWAYLAIFAPAVAVAVWLIVNLFLYSYRSTRARPAPDTTLGRATFWIGIVCGAFFCTGPLLGWLVVLIAPAGVLTGAIGFALESRANAGHNGRNLFGLELCAVTLALIAVMHFL
jgi:hypothetical protein